MSAAGWITMVIVLGVAWGGFVWMLALAMRRESQKRDARDR